LFELNYNQIRVLHTKNTRARSQTHTHTPFHLFTYYMHNLCIIMYLQIIRRISQIMW